MSLNDRGSSVGSIVIYGILSLISLVLAISSFSSPGNLAVQIVMSAITITLIALFGSHISAKFKGITIYPHKVTTSAFFNSDSVYIDDIISIKIEFIEYVEGFTRMRFLGSILQGDTLPTALSYEVETDQYILHGTLQNIEQSKLVEFISNIQQITSTEPQIGEINEEDMRGNVFYFPLKSNEKR